MARPKPPPPLELRPAGADAVKDFIRHGPRAGAVGYPEAPEGTAAHPQVPRGTMEHREAPQGTPRYPTAPEGTAAHPEVPSGTSTHPEAPQGAARHPEAPRAKGLIARKSGAVTRKMNVGFRLATADALEALCTKRGWRMNVFIDDAVRARLRAHGIELGDDENGPET